MTLVWTRSHLVESSHHAHAAAQRVPSCPSHPRTLVRLLRRRRGLGILLLLASSDVGRGGRGRDGPVAPGGAADRRPGAAVPGTRRPAGPVGPAAARHPPRRRTAGARRHRFVPHAGGRAGCRRGNGPAARRGGARHLARHRGAAAAGRHPGARARSGPRRRERPDGPAGVRQPRSRGGVPRGASSGCGPARRRDAGRGPHPPGAAAAPGRRRRGPGRRSPSPRSSRTR